MKNPVIQCWERCCVAVLLCAGGAAALAQEGQRIGEARDDAVAVQWLRRIQTAGEQTHFTGTVMLQQGQETHASRIAHRFDQSGVQERVHALDGEPHEFVRVNNEVRCLWPQARTVVVEWRAAQDNFPALFDGAAAEVLKHYQFTLGPVQRVAGQDCQVIELTARDALRYGHRLCAAQSNGMLLSAQVLGEGKSVVEHMAFTDVQMAQTLDRSAVEPSWPTEGWRVDRTEHEPVDVHAAGWSFWVPEGFRRVREVLRKMNLRGEAKTAQAKAKAPPTPDVRAMQSVYTDGLATLSVFIEPQGAAAPAPVVDERIYGQGATHALSRQVGRATVTVVGELPATTVRKVAQSVEFQAVR